MSNKESAWGPKLSTETRWKKTSQLENGQSIIGTVLDYSEGVIPSSGKKVKNVIMKDENGENFLLMPSGNVAYAVRDNLLKVGETYKIQKEGSRKVKGMTSGVFGIYPAKSTFNTNAATDTATDDL